MTKSQIEKANQAIRDAMDEEVNVNVPDLVLQKLNKLSNVLGLSSQCVSDSSYIYSKKIGELVKDYSTRSISATEKKLIFQSEAAEEIRLMEYSAQLNKDLHYSLEACRSMLSYIKSEMEQSLRSN